VVNIFKNIGTKVFKGKILDLFQTSSPAKCCYHGTYLELFLT